MLSTLPPLTAQGLALDLSPEAFGEVRGSEELLGQPWPPCAPAWAGGWLPLYPQFFRSRPDGGGICFLCRRLGGIGPAPPGFSPRGGGGSHRAGPSAVRPELVRNNAAVRRIIFGPELLGFYAELLGGPIRHFDHIWARAIGPGPGTLPHCDVVYMGRGSQNLLTCAGSPMPTCRLSRGLIVLEKSRTSRTGFKLSSYLSRRRGCLLRKPSQGRGGGAGPAAGRGRAISATIRISLREKLGRTRWLTAAWKAGRLRNLQADDGARGPRQPHRSHPAFDRLPLSIGERAGR